MLCNTILSMKIKLILSVQIQFKGLQNFKSILKYLGLCANRDLQVMGSCLPSVVGKVFDDVGGTVVLLERTLEIDRPGKRMT